MNYIKNLFFMLILIGLSGCAQREYAGKNINENYKRVPDFRLFKIDKYFTSLNDGIIDISNQLLLNIPDSTKRSNKIAITTFVNLDDFKNTSSFGRVISESLIDEMHIRKFRIIDFRQQNAISVNNQGEFILTRNVDKIIDEIPNALLLVGTYTVIDSNQIVINARILDNESLNVITTARVIIDDYKSCKQFELCDQKKIIVNQIPMRELCEPYENCKKDLNNKIYILDDEVSSSKKFDKVYMTDDQ